MIPNPLPASLMKPHCVVTEGGVNHLPNGRCTCAPYLAEMEKMLAILDAHARRAAKGRR